MTMCYEFPKPVQKRSIKIFNSELKRKKGEGELPENIGQKANIFNVTHEFTAYRELVVLVDLKTTDSQRRKSVVWSGNKRDRERQNSSVG